MKPYEGGTDDTTFVKAYIAGGIGAVDQSFVWVKIARACTVKAWKLPILISTLDSGSKDLD